MPGEFKIEITGVNMLEKEHANTKKNHMYKGGSWCRRMDGVVKQVRGYQLKTCELTSQEDLVMAR